MRIADQRTGLWARILARYGLICDLSHGDQLLGAVTTRKPTEWNPPCPAARVSVRRWVRQDPSLAYQEPPRIIFVGRPLLDSGPPPMIPSDPDFLSSSVNIEASSIH